MHVAKLPEIHRFPGKNVLERFRHDVNHEMNAKKFANGHGFFDTHLRLEFANTADKQGVS